MHSYQRGSRLAATGAVLIGGGRLGGILQRASTEAISEHFLLDRLDSLQKEHDQQQIAVWNLRVFDTKQWEKERYLLRQSKTLKWWLLAFSLWIGASKVYFFVMLIQQKIYTLLCWAKKWYYDMKEVSFTKSTLHKTYSICLRKQMY